MFEELRPPYRTIVADPPWEMEKRPSLGARATRTRRGQYAKQTGVSYSTLPASEIAAMPVRSLVDDAAHLYLWTVSAHLEEAFGVVRAWGFRPSQTLVWAKRPMGYLPGGAFGSCAEFIIFARRGVLPTQHRPDRSWWTWPRGPHSVKPQAFLDMVERVSPGPYLELFARQPRLGWDHWGWGYEEASPASAALG